MSTRTACILWVSGILHLALASAGLPFWTCPLQSTIGLPCPGCGLSRACLALLSGDVPRAMHLHAFAPLLIVGIPALIAWTFLSAKHRTRLARTATTLDRKWHIGWLLLIALLAYWLVRLALDIAPLSA